MSEPTGVRLWLFVALVVLAIILTMILRALGATGVL